MKLIFKQYLEELNERDEFDAIMPELLSELGFTILTTPSRGTRQHGVDISALGGDNGDENSTQLFLFTLKSGNLTRSVWDDGSPTAVRQSLNEIMDVYIQSRIPQEHQHLDIVICLCIGGEIREDVHAQWVNFTEKHTESKISFQEWNGDKIAGLLVSGVLGKDLVLQGPRSHFQKSIALVGLPDVSYRHFVSFTDALLTGTREKNLLKPFRQIYICCWVLYVWARSEENLDAPYQAVEYVLLQVWNKCRFQFDKEKNKRRPLSQLLSQIIELHRVIAEELLVTKFDPYLKTPFALSAAVQSLSSVDVNLAIFEQFGRLCLHGIWLHWKASKKSNESDQTDRMHKRDRCLALAAAMIEFNPTLLSPLRDDFMIEITFFVMLAQLCNQDEKIDRFISPLIEQLHFAIESRRDYPTPTNDYHTLLRYTDQRSDEHFKYHTLGSVLYPMLIRICQSPSLKRERTQLVSFIQELLSHTTLQVFFLNEDSEDNLWVGGIDHGTTVVDVPLCQDHAKYEDFIGRCIDDHQCFEELSSTKQGYTPILLTACRHFRFPIPPQLWIVKPQDI